MEAYYLIVEEWNYPLESGRDPHPLTYDTPEEALDACREMATAEVDNFLANVNMDCLPPARNGDGIIITTRLGLDPFYYYARVVRVEPELGRISEEINRKAKEKEQHDSQEA